MSHRRVKLSKEELKREIVELVDQCDNEKGELLYDIVSMLEVLPVKECQRTYDYLSELYFS